MKNVPVPSAAGQASALRRRQISYSFFEGLHSLKGEEEWEGGGGSANFPAPNKTVTGVFLTGAEPPVHAPVSPPPRPKSADWQLPILTFGR